MNQEPPEKSKVQECCNCHGFGKVTYISGLIGIWHDCSITAGVLEEHSWCTKWQEASEADLEHIRKELEDARKTQKKRG